MNQTGAPAWSFPGHSRIPILSTGKDSFWFVFQIESYDCGKADFHGFVSEKTFLPENTKNKSNRLSRFAPAPNSKGFITEVNCFLCFLTLDDQKRRTIIPSPQRGEG
jgi:hypothetical protein